MVVRHAAGYTRSLGLPHVVLGEGFGRSENCGAAKSKVLIGIISVSCDAYLGGTPGKISPFPIKTRVTLEVTPFGARVIGAAGTAYPSLEVWEYGGPTGPRLLAHFPAFDFPGPYLGLPIGAVPLRVE